MDAWQEQKDDADDRCELGELPQVTESTLHPEDQPGTISRSYSAPGALEELKATLPVSLAGGLSSSMSAPASPNMLSVMDRDTSLWLQRQKAAELAQIVRMRIIQEDMPVHRASVSCPDDSSFENKRSSMSLTHGLGIVHKEQEVDIASTALSALERYSIAVDSTSPNIPLTSLFQIDNTGKVVGAQSSPAGAHTPSTPVSPSTSGSSSFTESSGDELIESAIIVRMAQARSMEIKRGMLVSMDFQHPPMSRSAPTLVDAQFISQKEEKHEYGLTSPPPSLSPIVPSPTSLSADIEQSLEERVFAYRGSGEWSKENYKLTTPGQVRALVEALAISKPVSVEQQPERGWPWPAQRQQEH
ncbi:hypothetical protein BC835DRAFT_1378212 [Cytidiella melzeri]|nr:hypothetical protein BC835DRAFT_1378212 [Cytidiella melzeri]